MMKKKQHDHEDATAADISASATGTEPAIEAESVVDVGAAPEEAAAAAAAAEASVAATEPVTASEPPPVPDENAKLRAEVAELNDKYLRLYAEFENFRKRSFKDMGNARSMAVVDTILPFLRILDIFNMALVSAEQAPNIDALKQGMQMILTEYGRALEELGVKQFDAVGQPFDHSRHDAMAQEPSDQPEGTVIKQWSCGYQLGDRLLRPARVVVSSGPEVKKE